MVPAERNIVAVVLAAGASHRFGEANKLLARFDGRSLIERVIDALAAGGLKRPLVVTGWDRDGVASNLTGRDVQLVHNPGWEAGMGSSIGIGVGALGGEVAAALIVPGDMPLLDAQLVKTIISTFGDVGGERVVYPGRRSGEERSVVLWPRRFFAALQALEPQSGARSLLQSLAPSERVLVPVADETALIDVDTADDLRALGCPATDE